jgi:hypothetical protein
MLCLVKPRRACCGRDRESSGICYDGIGGTRSLVHDSGFKIREGLVASSTTACCGQQKGCAILVGRAPLKSNIVHRTLPRNALGKVS